MPNINPDSEDVKVWGKEVDPQTTNDTIHKDESLNMNQLLREAGRIEESPEEPAKGGSDQAKHGDTVQLDDGTIGIIVNLDHELDKLKKAQVESKARDYVENGEPLYKKLLAGKEGDTDLAQKVIDMDPMSESALAVSFVKRAYQGVVPTLHGLADAGTEEGKQFAEASNALLSGQVRLPTVEEYYKQKQMLEKKKEEENKKMEQQATENISQQEVRPTAQEPPVFNLAEAEEYNKVQQSQRQEIPQVRGAQHIQPAQVTEFKIPEGKTEEFVATLPEDQKQKVEASKKIVVEEQKMVKVPVATRKITNMDEYRRVARNKSTSEAVEAPLLNSGYIATMNGCGSLEMSSILPDPREMDWQDYPKLYNFCYNHLVATSVGYMSYNTFCRRTSPLDLTPMVYAILRASQPDENSITLTCGGEKCRKDYDITYRLSELMDFDSLNEEDITRIKKLQSVKNSLEAAKEVQNASPVMEEKYVDVGEGRTVVIKHPDGIMFMERTDDELVQSIIDSMGTLTALFISNIKSIFIEEQDENGEPMTYEVTDPRAIATEVQTFSDTQLELLKEENKSIRQYSEISYSFKNGEKGFVCPHCGLVNKKVSCSVQQLVFRRVSKAMN